MKTTTLLQSFNGNTSRFARSLNFSSGQPGQFSGSPEQATRHVPLVMLQVPTYGGVPTLWRWWNSMRVLCWTRTNAETLALWNFT
jgi:hypothetical protein